MSILHKIAGRILGNSSEASAHEHSAARAWQGASVCEALEARAYMGADPLSFTLYYPEGFANNSINEFVPITNPNAQPVQFQLLARYETGERDQIIATGTIAANSRGGVTVSDSQNPGARVVRPNTPYALVLNSSLAVTAAISRYDFGTAIGESFTETTSTQWTFGDIWKDTTDSRDFILVYNPSDLQSNVTITIFGANGIVHSESRLVDPQRRGGWSIQDITQVPEGIYGVRITATQFVVAAQSRYELNTGRGWGVIGTTNGSAADGVLTAAGYSDNFYQRNGDDLNGQRFAANSTIGILNTNSSPTIALVTLTFQFDNTNLNTQSRVVTVRANSAARFSLREFGLPQDNNFSVTYRANVPVTMTGARYQGQDATGMQASTVAATQWTFGEGYMSQARGGSAVIESLHIYNPTGITSLRLQIDVLGTNGSVLTIERFLLSRTITVVDLHNIDELRNRAADQWYGLRVTSVQPVVVSFEHWDAGNGGGFGSPLLPSNFILPFRDALAIDNGPAQ